MKRASEIWEAFGERVPQLLQKTTAFWRYQNHGMATRTAAAVERGQREPRRLTGCCRGWSPETYEWIQILEAELFTFLEFCFCFDLIVIVPWFSPLEVRNYFTYFLFYWSPQLRDFEFQKIVWILREIDYFKEWKFECVWIYTDCETFKTIYEFNVRSWGWKRKEGLWLNRDALVCQVY